MSAPSRRRWWYLGLTAMVAVAVIAALVVFSGGEATAKQFATLRVLEGDVSVSLDGAAYGPGHDGQSLTQGDRVRTGPDGLAEITYFDDSLTRLGPDTEFALTDLATLDNDAKSKRIKGSHDRGRTWNRVTKLADADSRFEIETPVATAAVRGTLFATDCDFFGTCTFVSIEDTIEICSSEECVTLNAFDVLVVSSDGTFGVVRHFDSLEELLAAFPWVATNACDIEDLADCSEPEEPEEPEPSPSPSASPTTDTGTDTGTDIGTDTGDPDTGDTGTDEPGTGGTPPPPPPPPPPPGDTTPPDAPVITSPTPGALLTSSSVTFQGDAEEGSLVMIFDDGTPVGSDTANSPFSVTVSLADGPHSITATATDAAGNESDPSDPLSIVVDAVNDPPVAVGDELLTAEDTPASINVLTNDSDPNGDLLSVIAVTDPAHGSVVNHGDGTVTYTPDANFSGSDSFVYLASDGRGGLAEATVHVTMSPVNDAPVAADDGAATEEDTPVSIDVLANDSDVDGDPLFVSAFTQPANGNVSLTEDGELRYAPDPDFSGTDAFTYTVSDGNGGTDSAVVRVEVAGVNDPPICGDHELTVQEDTPENGAVTCGDVDGPNLTYSVTNGPDHGTVDLDPDGTFTYTPDANYNGPDSFQVTASDGAGGSDVSTVAVTVVPVNDPPTARNDRASTGEDQSVLIDVLANDGDIDGNPLSIVGVSDPANGTAVVESGAIRYTPDGDFHGADSFEYTVSDGNGAADTATVSIAVTPVDDFGSASLGVEPGDGTAPLDVTFALSGADPDGIAGWVLDFDDGTTPASGSGAPPATVDHTYAEAGTYQALLTISDVDGNTSFAQATVTVSEPVVNHAPNAVNDSGTNNGEPVTIDVLSNDTDPDEGDSIAIVSFTQPGSGTVAPGEGFGTLVYTPEAEYTGSDAFSYTIEDEGGLQDTATVSIGATTDAVTISLSWSEAGRDLDLHLFTPSNQHLYWGNLCLQSGEGSCWATLDQDVTQGPPGTETITILPGVAGYEVGTYTVYVDNFSCAEHTFENVAATVTINTASASQTFSLPTTNRNLRQWDVATVSLDSGGAGTPQAVGTISGAQCTDPTPVGLTSAARDDGGDRRGRDRREGAAVGDGERRDGSRSGWRRAGGPGTTEPGTAESVTGLQARVDDDGTVRLSWQAPAGQTALARYSATTFPRQSGEGVLGCQGVARCEIRGLAPGSRIHVTVFLSGENRVQPQRAVNALEVFVPEAPVERIAPATAPAPAPASSPAAVQRRSSPPPTDPAPGPDRGGRSGRRTKR